MGTFINTFGELHIPEEKRGAFIADAKKLAHESGLFERRGCLIFGKGFFLLSFPTFTEDCANFNYSYYENDGWEDAGINIAKCRPYSDKIGFLGFSKAVQSFYLLAELYSDKLFFSAPGSSSMPLSTLRWIRYVLGTDDLHLTWRKDWWTMYELIEESMPGYFKDMDLSRFMDDLTGDVNDKSGLGKVFFGLGGIRTAFPEEGQTDFPKPDDKSVMSSVVQGLCYHTLRYKQSSPLSEDEQLERLLKMLTLDVEERAEWHKNELEAPILDHVPYIFPQVSVMVFSEIYSRGFITLWKQVKDHTTISIKDKPDTVSTLELERLTTEEFFRVSSDDRLYLWTEGGDVSISKDTQKWLGDMASRHKEIMAALPTSDGSDIIEWQKRLAQLAEETGSARGGPDTYSKVYLFEDQFYEFLASFHKPEFRAWLILMEERRNELTEYKRLVALLANKELRQKVFSI